MLGRLNGFERHSLGIRRWRDYQVGAVTAELSPHFAFDIRVDAEQSSRERGSYRKAGKCQEQSAAAKPDGAKNESPEQSGPLPQDHGRLERKRLAQRLGCTGERD